MESLTYALLKRRKFEPRGEFDDGHALIGSVAVHGAKPGNVLEIQVGTIRPGSYGFAVAIADAVFGIWRPR